MSRKVKCETACPLCSGEEFECISNTDRNRRRLATVLCSVCGHVFTNPQPTSEDLRQFYAKSYRAEYKGTLTPKLKHIYRAGLRALERASYLSTYISPETSLLDIGSGGGEFLYLMKKLGISVNGIEPNIGYANFSSGHYGVNVELGRVEDVASNSKTWDIITIHHVLEHLLAPVEVLKSLASLLNSSGIIALEVPNIEADYHSPNRQFHMAHLHNFSFEGLIFAANQAGLQLNSIQTMPNTKHLNAVFKKWAPQKVNLDPSVAPRVLMHLKNKKQGLDFLCSRPYLRLYANFKRPLKEYCGLLALGIPHDPKVLLDSLYSPVVLGKILHRSDEG